MNSWDWPAIPAVDIAVPELMLVDALTGKSAVATSAGNFRLYVCGITPYDATHLGHASTYLTFDLAVRFALAAGKTVTYTQNITDVDDPLLERATATGKDWRILANEQIALFSDDMAYLRVIPPTHFISVTERMQDIAAAVVTLRERGLTYEVFSEGAEPDVYLDAIAADQVTPSWRSGALLADGASAISVFDEHGGDSTREGKRDPLDSVLWRSARPGEPSWSCDGLHDGRPGWHIECAVIAAAASDLPYDVQGGGGDLVFPHHDFSSGHAAALTGQPLARVFSHVGLVSYQGAKMSKSLGNLVFVRDWRRDGVDPSAVRLALFSHAYSDEWEWFPEYLDAAEHRLERWRQAAKRGIQQSPDGEVGAGVIRRIVAALADNLDTCAVWDALDEWSEAPSDAHAVASAVDALTGVEL